MNIKDLIYDYQMEIINDYLAEVIKNSDICFSCRYNHGGCCFWGFECIQNNFDYYHKED